MTQLTRIRLLALESIRNAIPLMTAQGICRPSDWTGPDDHRLTICIAVELAASALIPANSQVLRPRVTDEAIWLVMRQVARANGANQLLQLQALRAQTAAAKRMQADALDDWQERISSLGVLVIILQRAGQIDPATPRSSTRSLAGGAA